jgi:hypothetical protein
MHMLFATAKEGNRDIKIFRCKTLWERSTCISYYGMVVITWETRHDAEL